MLIFNQEKEEIHDIDWQVLDDIDGIAVAGYSYSWFWNFIDKLNNNLTSKFGKMSNIPNNEPIRR